MKAAHYNLLTLYKEVCALQHQESNLYKTLVFASIIISLIALPVFPLLLIISIPLIGYFFYSYFMNKNKLPVCLQGIVVEKEHWYKPGPKQTDYDPESIDFEHHQYCIRLTIEKSFVLSEKGFVMSENLRKTQVIWINNQIFEFITTGQPYYFLISPTNDLLGFIDFNGKLISNVQVGPNEPFYFYRFSFAQYMIYPPSSEYTRIH